MVKVKLRPGVPVCPACNVSRLDTGPKSWYFPYILSQHVLTIYCAWLKKALRFESAVKVFENLFSQSLFSPSSCNRAFIHIEVLDLLLNIFNQCNGLTGAGPGWGIWSLIEDLQSVKSLNMWFRLGPGVSWDSLEFGRTAVPEPKVTHIETKNNVLQCFGGNIPCINECVKCRFGEWVS